MNTESLVEEDRAAAHVKTLLLQVRYIGARRPFVEPQTNPSTSLAQIKPLVLNFFKLVEGSVDGGTKTYLFSLDGEVLPNQSATVGSLAQGKHELKLDLIERFEQG